MLFSSEVSSSSSDQFHVVEDPKSLKVLLPPPGAGEKLHFTLLLPVVLQRQQTHRCFKSTHLLNAKATHILIFPYSNFCCVKCEKVL